MLLSFKDNNTIKKIGAIMHKTTHLHNRMNDRGIDNSMVLFTLDFGDIEGDKYVINHKAAQLQVKTLKKEVRKFEQLHKKFKNFNVVNLVNKKLEGLQKDYSVAKRICDKKGVVVVCSGDAIITTYNKSSYLSY